MGEYKKYSDYRLWQSNVSDLIEAKVCSDERENSNYIFLLFIAKKNINGIIANVTFRFSLGTLLFDFTHALEKCTTWKNGIFFILRINIKTPVNNPFFLEFLIRICMFQTLSFVSGFPFYWRRRRRRWHWKCFLISF